MCVKNWFKILNRLWKMSENRRSHWGDVLTHTVYADWCYCYILSVMFCSIACLVQTAQTVAELLSQSGIVSVLLPSDDTLFSFSVNKWQSRIPTGSLWTEHSLGIKICSFMVFKRLNQLPLHRGCTLRHSWMVPQRWWSSRHHERTIKGVHNLLDIYASIAQVVSDSWAFLCL